MVLQLVLIFVAAALLDVLTAAYTRSVADGHSGSAAVFSGLVTFANFGLLSVVLSTADTLGMAGAAAMAIGASVGTFVGLRGRALAMRMRSLDQRADESRPLVLPD